MNPDEVLLKVLKARDEQKIRPIEYWRTHCVNCGAGLEGHDVEACKEAH